MKKAEWLTLVTRDVTKYGHTTNETKELGKNIPCSDKVYNQAVWDGRKARDVIYEKHLYWQFHEAHDKAREKVRRHMSCGDRLDTPEGLQLLADYHGTMDAKKYVSEQVDAELEAL